MKSDARPVLIHPAFALEWRDFEDFRGEFGPYNGRYIPRYPEKWVAECLRHIDELDLRPLERTRLIERARSELTHCTMPSKTRWEPDSTWTENIRRSASSYPDAIVVGNGLDPTPFKDWVNCISDIRDTRARSWAYRGTVREYIDLCAPLILNSPSCYLIDPYLDPLNPDVQNLLYSLFDLIKGSRCYHLHVIIGKQILNKHKTEAKTSASAAIYHVSKELATIYEDRVGRERTLSIHFIEKQRRTTGELQIHDRFFLTNFGAISFGRGFVLEYQEHPQETAHVVDKVAHISLKKVYIDGVARHRDGLPTPDGIPPLPGIITIDISGDQSK